MNNISYLESYFKDELEKVKQQILELQKEQSKYDSLLEIIEQIKTDITEIDIDEFKRVLSIFESPEEAKKDTVKLKDLIEVDEYVNDPELGNLEIKQNILIIKEKLIEKLNAYYNLQSIRSRGRNSFIIKELTERKINLENILSLIQNSTLKRSLTKEEQNIIFDELQKSSIESGKVLEIIRDIGKANIERYTKQRTIKEKTITKKIEYNANIIHELLQTQGRDPKEVQEPVIEKVNKLVEPIELTEEEHQILNEIKSLIARKNEPLTSDIELLTKTLSNNYSLDERINKYYKNDKINWLLVIEDLKINLIPNINNNKEKIFEIFKYILNQEKEEKILEEARKEKEAEQRNKLQNLIEIIDNFLDKIKIYVGKLETLTVNEKNEVIELTDAVEKNNFEKILKSKIGLNVHEIIIIGRIIPDLVELKNLIKETIDSNNAEEEIYIEYNEALKEILQKYNEIEVKYEKPYEEYKKSIELSRQKKKTKKIKSTYNIETTKNIILILKDEKDIPCVEKDIESYKQSRDDKEDSLKKTINIFQTMYYNSEYKQEYNDTNHKDGKVFYGKFKKTLDRGEYDEEMSPRRCKPQSTDSRVCYLKIPICEENRKKLYTIYKNQHLLNNQYKDSLSVIMLVGVATVYNGNHSEYDNFKDYINKKRNYIKYVKTLFNNPKASVEELTRIINESTGLCHKYTQTGGGMTLK